MTEPIWISGGAVKVELTGPRNDGEVRIELSRDQATFTFAVSARDWADLRSALEGLVSERHEVRSADIVEARTYASDVYVLSSPSQAKHFKVGDTWHWCDHGVLCRSHQCRMPGSFAGRVTRVDQYHGIVTLERIEQ